MEAQENKEGEKGGCCTKGKCCGGKALGAVALLVVGGIGGYFAGRHCTACAMTSGPAISAPAQNPAK
jgi:hypothetical protein